MKIRSDFVTNSSSSSFVVDILLTDIEDREFSVRFPEDDPDGMCGANIRCSAKQIAAVDDINELITLLTESAGDKGLGTDSAFFEQISEAMKQFGRTVRDEVFDIDQIAKIELTRTWSAWGEASSCFATELYDSDCEIPEGEEIPELAEKVCQSEGQEKEDAKRELINHLAQWGGTIYGGWGDRIPGFLGEKPKITIDWQEVADSIEEFAQKVVDGELSAGPDHAVETVEIDMQTHEISSRAEYTLQEDMW